MPPRQAKKRPSSNDQPRKSPIKKPSMDQELPPAPLNPQCRELLVGYFLRKTDGLFDQMYVDTKNNSFLVPETPMIDFHRLFLINKYFNRAVRSYFQYLQYHYSITSRWSDEFYFQNTPRMFSESLNNLPSLEHAKHNSVVVFQNGSIFHIFKAKNFLQLRSEGLFREKAYSLTFYGSDTTQVPIKKDLFTDLKALNFQTSQDLSGIFKHLLNDSFTSLKHLTFYHRHFLDKLDSQVVFPPNLQYLHPSSNSISIMACDLDSYRHLLQVDTKELTIGIELINKLARLNDDPILLKPQVERLTIHWTADVNETHAAQLIRLIPNHSLKRICFRKRELKDLYGDWHASRSLNTKLKAIKKCVNEIDIYEIADFLQQMCRQTGITVANFPFKIIFELGLFVFYRRAGNRIPFSKHPLDIQFVFEDPKTVKFLLLQNSVSISDGVQLKLGNENEDLDSQICAAMLDFWPKLEMQESSKVLVDGRTKRGRGRRE